MSKSLWIAPLSVVAMTFGIFVGIEDTDAFFWSGYVVALLCVITTGVSCGCLVFARGPYRVASGAAAIAATALGVAWIGVEIGCVEIRDVMRFQAWAATHPTEVAADQRRDGIVKHWESTGFLDMSNDTYLAADPDDTLASASRGPLSLAERAIADRWGRSHRLSCGIDRVEQMAKGLYFIKTSDCMLYPEP